MDAQRIYDALLIKAFRADVTLNDLRFWLKPYNIGIQDPNLKRQPPRAPMRVQIFVGSYLKPLADRLWDTDKTQDIKTLDWMTKWDSKFTDRINASEKQNLVRKNQRDRRRGAFLANNWEAQKRISQWGVTK